MGVTVAAAAALTPILCDGVGVGVGFGAVGVGFGVVGVGFGVVGLGVGTTVGLIVCVGPGDGEALLEDEGDADADMPCIAPCQLPNDHATSLKLRCG
jgi:hypothetical protein